MGFQQGLSGLNASSKNLDVIGHNIANSNTTGFKASRTEFAAMVASAIGTSGGSNVGIGVETAAIAQQFDQGSLTVTGNSLDVAINGNGFFTLQMPDGTPAYTRAGNFKMDDAGHIITNGGARVMGVPVNPMTGEAMRGADAVPMQLPTGTPIAAKETRLINASFNLDARAKDAAGNPTATPPIPATPRATYGTSVNVYDSQGVATPVTLYFMKTANANEWGVYTTLDETSQPTGSPPFTISFDDSGKITGPTAQHPYTAVDTAGFYLSDVVPTNNPNVTDPLDNQTDPMNHPSVTEAGVFLDLSAVTQFGTKFAVSDLTQSGYASGSLTGVSIADDGKIMARYSNGVSRAEGQLTLASFRNTQGLTALDGNNWVATASSGPAVMGSAGEGNFGSLRSGALEDSNVDLTAELVNMMTAQRAYQANAQTIKTQDQVLSTLVNLR
ncbi:flagellar hook protein FlgE [Oryzisolibacter propanilivorax]|uniref:Flagellar hook protein FlgE n=1 Tax=Oryzisolibacter propanilivorax TaxID=1527607 RepID=A0A1G9V5S4_9BURK|nr:flagellar hook protein FlgE [Oryzisolibacter propanilivorax]SDM67499.1 flagellar hook protein FlgE [Oryzisolibacter propanilivorax]